jgi:Rod binding domain-containing protein
MMDATALAPTAAAIRAQSGIARNGDGAPLDEARRVAEQFESFFIARMLDQITEQLPTDGPFGGGHAERVFRGMLNEQYAETITRAGGLGIAESTYREILAIQEAGRS